MHSQQNKLIMRAATYLNIVGFLIILNSRAFAGKDTVIVSDKIDFITLQPIKNSEKPISNKSIKMTYKNSKIVSIEMNHATFGKRNLKMHYLNDSMGYFVNYTSWESFWGEYESEVCYFNFKNKKRWSVFYKSKKNNESNILKGYVYQVNTVEKSTNPTELLIINSYSADSSKWDPTKKYEEFLFKHTHPDFRSYIYYQGDVSKYLCIKKKKTANGTAVITEQKETIDPGIEDYLWTFYFQ
jgi:hypothetical protein